MIYIVLDIETTGRSSYSKIIEFTGLKYEDEKLIDEYTTFINPTTNIPSVITQKTGITNDMVKDAPLIKEVIGKIVDFINGQTLVGYNIASFDVPFIRRVAEEYDLSFDSKIIDLLPVARRTLTTLPDHKLTTVATYYDINVSNAHRSRADCLITYAVYQNLKDFIAVQKPKAEKPHQTFDDTEEADVASISIKDSSFVLTGDFASGDKNDIKAKIEQAGGFVKSGVSKKINYLVVGGLGSDRWKFGNQGSKITKAKELQEQGIDIHIISEDDLLKLL